VPFYFHAESDSYFYQEQPLQIDSFDAGLCEEVNYFDIPSHAKEKLMVTLPIIDADVIETLATREAVGDPSTTPNETASVVSSQHAYVVPNDKLVKVFIRIRDAKAALRKKMEAEVEALDAQLRSVAAELKARCLTLGATSFKTDEGTVYISETLKVSCGDWGIFYDWIKENDKLDMLEQRVKAGEIKIYMDSHKGELPPGISIFRETEARIRKPTKKGGSNTEAPEQNEA